MKPRPPVGASLLAMVVNDNAGNLAPRGALRFFASELAPTRLLAKFLELLSCRPILQRFRQMLTADRINLFQIRQSTRHFEQSVG